MEKTTESQDLAGLFAATAGRASFYLDCLSRRHVLPTPEALASLRRFRGDMPSDGLAAAQVLAELDELGSPATVASAAGRYFGLVIGGALPATVAASWLATAWDQNAVFSWTSPVAAMLEEVSLDWLVELLDLPRETAGAFVSGASMATLTALAAARHALLARAGWDVEAQGLFGAPELRVIIGDEVHVTVLKALALLGLGRERLVRVPVDDQGRMRVELLPPLDARSIICIQAGNVNTGAFDPAAEICGVARTAGAWVHVDGAFGLWARATSELAHLAAGVGQADSWATDGHKWLNVPYDSGIALVRNPVHLRAAMAASAAYLAEWAGEVREPSHFTPELSRRARGVEIWAALRNLGRAGVANLVARCCVHARRFAEGLREQGFEVLNHVVLNQVLVSFGSPETTRAVIAALQADGTCWCGGTVWQGRTAMRISVSSWATTRADVEASLAAMVRMARRVLDAERAA